jgi:hypothetical protein
MRVQILDLTKDDLIEGFHFYQRKEEGLGRRFLVSLYCLMGGAAPNRSQAG